MISQSSRRPFLAVRTAKATVAAAAAGTAIVLTLGGAIADPRQDAPSSSDTSARLAERAGLDSRCLHAPGKAIVRTPGGETRTVSFAQGWKIYRGERPGRLIAVCPD